MQPCKLWIEQCDAARRIEDEFGTQRALDYLVGEKFLNFLEAAESHAELRGEIPAFVTGIKGIFEPWQLAAYLETARHTEPFDAGIYEGEEPEIIEDERKADSRRCASDLLLVERAGECCWGRATGEEPPGCRARRWRDGRLRRDQQRGSPAIRGGVERPRPRPGPGPYADGFEVSSPLIAELAGEPPGTLRGKDAVGAYWRRALGRLPDLRFEVLGVYAGVGSVLVHYRAVAGLLACEVFSFDAEVEVVRAATHYADAAR